VTPQRVSAEGRYVRLEPLSAVVHGDALWACVGGEEKAGLWTWMPDGPFAERIEFNAALEAKAGASDPLFSAIVDRATGLATGMASLMRIEPKHRVIEVGGIMYSPLLQRTRGATEAMYLMARYVFDELGYRRYEWKCNSLNEPSRHAAQRLGFQYEGLFRQHMIIKGVNRDTAWFSMLDTEWLSRKVEFERWLLPENFDEAGRQKSALGF
jgi:RimJ/RimL family protein N-acetyltransferase